MVFEKLAYVAEQTGHVQFCTLPGSLNDAWVVAEILQLAAVSV